MTKDKEYRDQVGMSELDRAALDAAKESWQKASDAGDRAGMDTAHRQAEAIRAQYNYSGGGDGEQYISTAKTGSADRSGGGVTYRSLPAYTSQYQGKIDALTEKILGRAAFSYDPEKDPTYRQYREQYTRGGEKAMQDTLGQVAARTGGLASSYAGQAAQQTYDGYMAQLADKVPELKQLAYQMYLDEGDAQRSDLSLLSSLEARDYSRYQDALNQYNTDRSFQYGVYRDGVADQRYDREYADSRADTEWQRSSYASEQEYDRALQKAQTLAASGDFSGYRELGYSDGEISRMKASYDAARRLTGKSEESSKNSAAYKSVLAKATGFGEMSEAKGYLERMVEGGYITPDEAAYIYQVELGGQLEQALTGSAGAYLKATGGRLSGAQLQDALRAKSSERVQTYKDTKKEWDQKSGNKAGARPFTSRS